MRIFYYFCRKYLFVAAIVFVAVGCSDIIEIEHDKDIIGGNGKGLSVIEAKEFFEKSIMSKSRAEQEPKDDKYYKERCMLPVGDFVPQWEEGISTDAPTLFSVDVPIKATYRYRALRIDDKTQKVYTTTCYQELVVVKDLEGRMGYKVVLFIPDREYSIKNPGDVSRRLTNGIDMGDYSGLKIYTDIEGRMTRVNRFLNGKKIVGIDLTTPGTFKERLAMYVMALKTIGQVSIQRQGAKTMMSRGEDDWYDESYDDWWGNYYDDESDISNDYYEKVDVLPGEDVYYNHYDGNYYIDFGADGHVDSCISDEFITTPPDEGSQTTPPDDPIDDPGDAPGDRIEWGDITDNSDMTDSGNNGSGDSEKNENVNQLIQPITLSLPKSSFPGYDVLHNCKTVADEIMRTLLGFGKNIGSSSNVVQLYKQDPSGKLDLVGTPENIFNILCNHLKNEHPITVGVDKNGKFYGYNNDQTTDHFIVINGVEYDKEKGLYYFKYIETGRSKNQAEEAISDDNRIYYDPSNSDRAFEGSNWKGDKYVIVQVRPNLIIEK